MPEEEKKIVYKKVMRPHRFIQVQMMDGDPMDFEEDEMITVHLHEGFVNLLKGSKFVAAINATKVRTVTTFVRDIEETIAVPAPVDEPEDEETEAEDDGEASQEE